MARPSMKPFLTLIFSLLTYSSWSSTCCVSNTGLPNLIYQGSRWQQTFSVSQGKVIGDVDQKGSSTFRNDENKDEVQFARLDLAYAWTQRYQTNLGLKYQ